MHTNSTSPIYMYCCNVKTAINFYFNNASTLCVHHCTCLPPSPLQEGHLSSTGECFDIGKTTRKALHAFDASGHSSPYCGPTTDAAAGNGSLMRLCPVVLAYHNHPVCAMELSRESSRVTHGAQAALDACMWVCCRGV